MRLLSPNKNLTKVVALFFLVAISLAFIVTTPAHADFGVYVGYSGGPYYKKVVYTDDEMKAMSDGILYKYSGIDQMPSVRKGFARGVRLTTFFNNTGIKVSALKRFWLATNGSADRSYIPDDGGEGKGAWYYNELCVVPRYYYDGLFDAFYVDGQTNDISVDVSIINEHKIVRVPTIIACESSWSRCSSADDWNRVNMITGIYRLMFGQTEAGRGDSHSFANDVNSITCIFEGTPKISFGGQTTFEGQIGDVITITPKIEADDPLIEQLAVKDLKWTISDTSVVQFVKDEKGNIQTDDNGNIQIKIVGNGEVNITASFGESPYSKYVATATIGRSGNGSGKGEGDGEGDESGASGDGEGKGGKSNGQSDSEVGDNSDSGVGSGADVYEDEGDYGEGENEVSSTSKTSYSIEAKSGQPTHGTREADVGSSGGGGSQSETNTPSVKIKASERQAWAVGKKIGSQSSMVDDPLFIVRPAVLAAILFGFFVLGCIIRVVACDRAKDPYVDKRLQAEKNAFEIEQ